MNTPSTGMPQAVADLADYLLDKVKGFPNPWADAARKTKDFVTKAIPPKDRPTRVVTANTIAAYLKKKPCGMYDMYVFDTIAMAVGVYSTPEYHQLRLAALPYAVNAKSVTKRLLDPDRISAQYAQEYADAFAAAHRQGATPAKTAEPPARRVSFTSTVPDEVDDRGMMTAASAQLKFGSRIRELIPVYNLDNTPVMLDGNMLFYVYTKQT